MTNARSLLAMVMALDPKIIEALENMHSYRPRDEWNTTGAGNHHEPGASSHQGLDKRLKTVVMDAFQAALLGQFVHRGKSETVKVDHFEWLPEPGRFVQARIDVETGKLQLRLGTVSPSGVLETEGGVDAVIS